MGHDGYGARRCIGLYNSSDGADNTPLLSFVVVYLYRAGNSVACKTGIMPPFHHHGRGQRDGIPPLFLPVGAVGSALAVLHVACCLAQSSRRRRPEATRAHTTIPQAPSGPEALSWPTL